jgi:hypothetical protein
MRSKFRNLLMGLSIMMIGGAAWAGSVYRPVQTSRADGVEVRRGASWVSEPVAPDFVIAALGELTPAVAWRPGDPIREVPRQFFGLTTRPAPVPANPASRIDDLAVTQAAAHPTRQSEAFTTPLVNIAGQGFSGVLPPDPAGDIGSTHYIQAVNGNGGALYRIYDKSGNAVTGALSMEVLAAGGACASGFGDPIVLYDEIANRWLLTEFSSTAGRSLCIYHSQFADPTILQTWTRYVVQTPSFPDYPKYGVWPQAYYVGSNEAGAGAEIYALDRVKMLAGQPIVTQRFIAPELPEAYGGLGMGCLAAGAVLIHLFLPEGHALRQAVGGEWRAWALPLLIGGLVWAYRAGLSRLRARLPVAPPAPASGAFSAAELDRYARHIVLREIGGAGQKKLRAARVLVVGAGGRRGSAGSGSLMMTMCRTPTCNGRSSTPTRGSGH